MTFKKVKIFEKNVRKFWLFLKSNISLKKIIKIFWTRIFEFKKNDYFFKRNIWLSKKVKIFENCFRKKVAQNFFNSKKLFFCRWIFLKIFRIPQNTWKPRKSQFSAQSSHPVSICALQLFRTPPHRTLSVYVFIY